MLTILGGFGGKNDIQRYMFPPRLPPPSPLPFSPSHTRLKERCGKLRILSLVKQLSSCVIKKGLLSYV